MPQHIIFVGADKGGVGKTTISRVVADLMIKRGAALRLIDTDEPGVLYRFHKDAEVVDLSKIAGQMKVADATTGITLVDIRAGLLTPTLQRFQEFGLLNDVATGTLKLTVLHVLGPSVTSLGEIGAVAGFLATGGDYWLVQNQIAEDAWSAEIPANYLAAADAKLIKIEHLPSTAAEAVDVAGVSFEQFSANPNNSRVLRGAVRYWLDQSYKALAPVKLE